MPLTAPTILLTVALFAGGCLALAIWLSWRASGSLGASKDQRRELGRLQSMLDAGPAVPILVRRDGTVQAGVRAASLLGLEEVPQTFSQLVEETGAFAPDDRKLISERVRAAARTGAASTLILRPQRADAILRIAIDPAPAGFGAGTALLWLLDVTAQEQQASASATEADRRANALEALTELIEAAPFPIWYRGPDRKLAMVNSAYVAAVEAESGAEVIAAGVELVDQTEGLQPLPDGVHSEDEDGSTRRTLPATVAGERRMMQIVELPVGPGGVAGFAIDVDEQEQARAELGRFQSAQRDLLDRLSAGVAQFGRDRSLTFFNQPFARLFGLTGDFLGDRPEFDRVIDAMRDTRKLPEPRDFPTWKAERRAWFTAGTAAIEEDWELPDRRHLRVVAQPLPDGGLLAIFEDRTRQIMLESDRERMVKVQNTTFDNLAEGIAVFSSDRRLKLWNTRFRTMWDLKTEHVAERPVVEALATQLAPRIAKVRQGMMMRDLVRGAIVSRRPRTGKVQLVDGRALQLAAIPIPGEDVLFTTLDVTDSARVESALRERTLALEEADRIKTAFVSNISYELRTPLTSIGGFAEMMAAGYAGELPASARDYVTAILTSVARLSTLIDDILDLTQSDVGALLLAEEEVDIAEMLEGLLDTVRELAEPKQIRFSSVLQPSAGSIIGDRRRLAQALLNLLRNAVQFTPAGGAVRLTCEGDEESARIIVADSGPGVAPADQTRIFDRFQRTAAENGAGGVGLGLPLARQFVEAHGGTIGLTSDSGAGAEFIVSLPRTAEQRAAYLAAHAAAASA